MLVLTRKLGEGIVIGDDVTITIVEMKGGNVRIGIDGEKWIYINRTKTDTQSRIPILPKARTLLKRYSV